MKKMRGMGSVYQPTYRDRRTGEQKTVGTWWIRYHHRGKLYRESADSTNRADAVRMLKARIGEIGEHGRVIGPTVEKTTFDDIAKMLIDDYKARGNRSLRRIAGNALDGSGGALRHLRDYFGRMRAVDITPDQVRSYIADRQEEDAAAATVNRELSALRRALVLAEAYGKIAHRPRFELLPEDNARAGFFEREEFEAVRENLPEFLKPVATVAYITGWRPPSELQTRQRRHVDLEAGWLRLDPGESKTREGRMFPIDQIQELRVTLADQLMRTRALELATGRTIPWLFHREGMPIKDYYYHWRKACEIAGLTGWFMYDFRRTAVRNLERAGVSRSAAMKMTGHKTEAVYRRYAIVDESMLREGAAKLAALHDSDRQSRKRRVLPFEIPNLQSSSKAETKLTK